MLVVYLALIAKFWRQQNAINLCQQALGVYRI